MIDVRNFTSQEKLKNGIQVTVRTIRPDDKDALLAAFKELDERTIFLRFFGIKKELSKEELKILTEVDFDRTVSLVMCLQSEAKEIIIGGGSYFAFGHADPLDMAEVSFTVEEDYHGLGIASITLGHLARIAKEKGIEQFHAEVLPENKGMLAVFKRSGFPHKQEYADGFVHVVLSLAGNN